MSNQEAKILSWLYTAEVSGDNEAAENLKQEVLRSLDAWVRRNDQDKLPRSYGEEARQGNQAQKFYWE